MLEHHLQIGLPLHPRCGQRVLRLERCSSLLSLDKVSKLPLCSLNRSLAAQIKNFPEIVGDFGEIS